MVALRLGGRGDAMLIYCCIDGTDNYDPTDAPGICMIPSRTETLDTSHVKRMGYRGFAAPGFKYFRGTTDSIFGSTSALIIDEALGWIDRVYGSAPDSTRKLFLGGFSRGGAAALVIANRLAARDIPVQEMYLFDAVDRSWFMDDAQTGRVPGNVVKAFHALRDPKGGSRRSFSNCGLDGTGGNLEKKHFLTTHGAVGGWPNGRDAVTPGPGAEDYAYVARAALRSRLDLNPFNDDALSVGDAAAADIIADPRQSNIHEFGEPYPTTITPEQELAGMREAWAWMFGKSLSTLQSG